MTAGVFSFLKSDYIFYYKGFGRITLLSGVLTFFTFLSMIVTKPFPIYSVVKTDYTVVSIVIGVLGLCTFQLWAHGSPVLFRSWHIRWAVYKELMFVTSGTFAFNLFNLGYIFFFCEPEIDSGSSIVYAILGVTSATFGICIIIVTLFTLINHLVSRHFWVMQPSAQLVQDKFSQTPISWLHLEQYHGVKSTIPIDQIYLIEGMGNYLKVYYWNGSFIDVSITRLTLKEIENLPGFVGNLFRIHRSYMVNIHQVDVIERSSPQTVELRMKNIDMYVPVANGRLSEFLLTQDRR